MNFSSLGTEFADRLPKDTRIMNILAKYVKEISGEHEVVAVMLYGSQNYGLDINGSDVDAKAIVIPRFRDFVKGKKMVSGVKDFGENGQCDVKDIRLMFDCFKKQNVNFLEILFTKYCFINDKYRDLIKPIFDNAERIAHYNMFAAVNCMRGMALEKFNALKHPYPTILHKIEKFGYDPKQLHHIMRLEEFMIRYIAGEPFGDCLKSKNVSNLIDIKQGSLSLEAAEELAKMNIELINDIRTKFFETETAAVDKGVDDLFEDVVYNIFKHYFKEQIVSD